MPTVALDNFVAVRGIYAYYNNIQINNILFKILIEESLTVIRSI